MGSAAWRAERDKVSAWRLIEIGAHAKRACDVRYSAWGMAHLLKRLRLSRQKTQPYRLLLPHHVRTSVSSGIGGRHRLNLLEHSASCLSRAGKRYAERS